MSEAKILYNKKLADGYFRIGLSCEAKAIVPGQFVMLKIQDGFDPLLRRPFGIYNVIKPKGSWELKGSGIEVLYRVVGKGTRILSSLKTGEKLDILSPLGNGFPKPADPQDVIMVAGGMGIAPLYLLAKSIRKGLFLFGARGSREAAFANDFKRLGCEVRLSTDDGSVGRKGFVTELLEEAVTPGSVIYACGPAAMIKRTAEIARKTGAKKCFVSLENSMACGIGVCLGCAVKAKTHAEAENRSYKMVCSEGPVFESSEIDWEAYGH